MIVMGDVAEAQSVPARVPTDEVERVCWADFSRVRQHPFGLFDNDPAIERRLQLFDEDLTAADRSFLQQTDRGDVRQGLHDLHIGVGETAADGALNTLSAPIVSCRSRSGKACTDRKPAATACRAKSGHRSSASARSALMTGAPVRNASMHGPVCSWV